MVPVTGGMNIMLLERINYVKKHLVYAEDIIYEIMQYHSNNITKRAVRDCVELVIAEKRVSVWYHIWHCVKSWFTRV